MWNLSGDDILHAKEELKGRRAAIQAHYDTEMKRLEADIANLETFEQAALKFVANFKGGSESGAVEETEAAEATNEAGATHWEAPAEGDSNAGSSGDEAKSGSRWRVRFGTAEASP